MKTLLIARLFALVVFGALAAIGIVWLIFAVLVPRMPDDAATWFLGAILALWLWKFLPLAAVILKRLKL